MSNALRTIEFLCLGVWLGGVCLLSFVVAPGAFSVLANRDVAGSMVAYTLGRAHFIGIGAGIIYLVANFLNPSVLPTIARLAAIAVIIMLLLTVFSQFYVMAHLADLRSQMGSVDRTPKTDPLRVEFDKLHQWSVWIESTVLLLGIAAVYLTVRAK
jgi:Domain of unknown function (DUF4149)